MQGSANQYDQRPRKPRKFRHGKKQIQCRQAEDHGDKDQSLVAEPVAEGASHQAAGGAAGQKGGQQVPATAGEKPRVVSHKGSSVDMVN